MLRKVAIEIAIEKQKHKKIETEKNEQSSKLKWKSKINI